MALTAATTAGASHNARVFLTEFLGSSSMGPRFAFRATFGIGMKVTSMLWVCTTSSSPYRCHHNHDGFRIPSKTSRDSRPTEDRWLISSSFRIAVESREDPPWSRLNVGLCQGDGKTRTRRRILITSIHVMRIRRVCSHASRLSPLVDLETLQRSIDIDVSSPTF